MYIDKIGLTWNLEWSIVVNDRNQNFRPKPEPEPKSFRFGNSYRNRNGHLLYCGENISNLYRKYIANSENLKNFNNIVSVLSFGFGSVPVR